METIGKKRVERHLQLALYLSRCRVARRFRVRSCSPRCHCFCCRCRRRTSLAALLHSRLAVIEAEHPVSSTGSNTMPRGGKDEETTLHWNQKQKEELLHRLAEYNRNYHGRKPTQKNWEDWANELQKHFTDPVTAAKVQQMRVRLKGKFDKEVILLTSIGLGWDPVTGAVTCTDEYWDDFAKNKKWANAAKKQPLKNFDLYCEAFGNTQANGAHARGLENPTTEHVDTIPIPDVDGEVGATSHSLGSDDDFVTTMRAGLNTARKGLNVASSSKGIGKKSARSCKRPVGDPEAKALLGRLVASIETRRSSKATSSSATQSPTTRSLLQKCQDLVKGMDLDDDSSVTFLEAIAWYPHMQQLFIDMTETQRVCFVRKTITSKTNQTTQPCSMPPPSMASNFMQPPYQNFIATPNFYQQPPIYGQQPPNFG